MIHVTSSAQQGGGAWHIISLASASTNSFYDTTIVVPKSQPLTQTLTSSAPLLQYFPFSLPDYFSLLFAVACIAKCYKKVIVHSHGPAAAFVVKFIKLFFPRIAHVYTPHGVQFTFYSYWKNSLYKVYELITRCFIDGIIYISDHEARTFSDYGLLTNKDSVVIDNLVNPKKIALGGRVARSPDAPLRLGMIARICRQKQSPLIFDLCSLLPSVHFVYVGQRGDLESEFLKMLSCSCPTNLVYLPSVNDMASFYASLDGILMPSVHEGLPYVFLEAVCNHIPIFCSPIPPFTCIYDKYPSPLINIVMPSNNRAFPAAADFSGAINSFYKSCSDVRSLSGDPSSLQLISRYSDIVSWARSYDDAYHHFSACV